MKHSDVTRYLRELLALCNHMQCLLWKKNNGKPRTVHTVCLCLGWTTFCSVLQIYQKKQCQTPLDLEITFRLYIKQHKRWNKSQNTYRHKLEVSADSPPLFSRRQRKVQWIDSALKHRHIGTHRPAAQTHRNTGNSTDTSEHPDQHRHIGTHRPQTGVMCITGWIASPAPWFIVLLPPYCRAHQQIKRNFYLPHFFR